MSEPRVFWNTSALGTLCHRAFHIGSFLISPPRTADSSILCQGQHWPVEMKYLLTPELRWHGAFTSREGGEKGRNNKKMLEMVSSLKVSLKASSPGQQTFTNASGMCHAVGISQRAHRQQWGQNGAGMQSVPWWAYRQVQKQTWAAGELGAGE